MEIITMRTMIIIILKKKKEKLNSRHLSHKLPRCCFGYPFVRRLLLILLLQFAVGFIVLLLRAVV